MKIKSGSKFGVKPTNQVKKFHGYLKNSLFSEPNPQNIKTVQDFSLNVPSECFFLCVSDTL